MKRIFEGKVYDTEKAEEIGEYTSIHPVTDFRWYEEHLYKTRKGNYFMVGEGGPKSPYTTPVGNGISGDKKLIPITEEEAFEWCERTENYDLAEKEFGDMIEDA